jgi:hypothetical protein
VTPAQKLAGLVGLLLLAFGALGFTADASFATGGALESGEFLGFAVNGWTNAAHVGLGLLLLAAAGRRPLARGVWRLVFFTYLIVVIWGYADGDSVAGLFPVNGAVHGLDIALLLLGLVGTRTAKERRGVLERDTIPVAVEDGPRVVGPGSGHVGGRRAGEARIDARLPKKT